MNRVMMLLIGLCCFTRCLAQSAEELFDKSLEAARADSLDLGIRLMTQSIRLDSTKGIA